MEIGDRIFGLWETDWWYPGVIVDKNHQGLEVQFDDGDRAMLSPESVRRVDVSPGMRVFGRWNGGGIYYPGRIADIQGAMIAIDYDDGDSEKTTVSMIRMNSADLT
jgi:DUF971 family protein